MLPVQPALLAAPVERAVQLAELVLVPAALRVALHPSGHDTGLSTAQAALAALKMDTHPIRLQLMVVQQLLVLELHLLVMPTARRRKSTSTSITTSTGRTAAEQAAKLGSRTAAAKATASLTSIPQPRLC